MRIFKTALGAGIAMVLLGSCINPRSLPPSPAHEPQSAADRMQWWREARFGLFIHWGPVSLVGTEIGWSRAGERRGYGSRGEEVPAEFYDNLFTQFNPTNFVAEEWVALARDAGMKYLVFTSRHHDGFSMFDTRASEYCITSADSPFRRDVVRELATAARKGGLRFGLYYSQPDWHHPDAFTADRHERYLEYLRRQVTELGSQYGRLDILWFDGLGKRAEEYDGAGLVRIIRSLQPGIIVNDRTGLPEDHDTPEQRVGKFQNDRPWESCITLCRQWSWKPNDEMKSLKECLQTLVLCAGGDGNLLLNVGPMPDGQIEARQAARLREMGEWLRRYGSTLYGTRGGPWKPNKTCASTRRGQTIFVHVFRANHGELRLPPIDRRVTQAVALSGSIVSFSQDTKGLLLVLDRQSMDPIDTIVRLDLDGSAMDLPEKDLPAGLRASASNVYQQRGDDYGPEQAFDNDPGTRWATDPGTRTAWLAVEWDAPITVQRLRIEEALPSRVQRFEFQYRDGADWKTIFSGTTLGAWFQQQFPPVTAREFRLSILEATEGPTIADLELFEQ